MERLDPQNDNARRRHVDYVADERVVRRSQGQGCIVGSVDGLADVGNGRAGKGKLEVPLRVTAQGLVAVGAAGVIALLI